MGSNPRFWRKRLAYPLYVLVFVLLGAEITVRILGYTAWQPAEQSFSVEPDGSFFRPDSLLGYAGRAGRFSITLGDTLHYTVTHRADGFRITAPLTQVDTADRPEIWILGCSFTHGFGVNDADNYPWMLQADFPQYRIRNWAMDGYGTLHAYRILQAKLKAERPPALVILAYGAFHDQRNTSNRYWRKVLQGREMVAGIRYPQARFDESGNVQFSTSQLEYRPFPLMQYSALSHLLEMTYNRQQDQQLRSEDITTSLIDSIQETLLDHKVSLLIAGIFHHPETTRRLQEFKERGHAVADISVDVERPELRILPSDGHPNRKAHRMMADKLALLLPKLLNGEPNFGNE